MRNILSHTNPLTISLAFLAFALCVHAYSAGELATAWLMVLAYLGGLVSGVIVALMVAARD